jgi:hypothetical protein
MRILLAGLAAGIAMFAWSTVAHLATSLPSLGISTLPDESVTVGNLSSAIGDKGGLYLFPSNMGNSPSSSAATAPGGLLVFNPKASTSAQPPLKNLIIEFFTELTEGLIAAWLVAQTALVSYFARVGFVAMIGLAAAITTNIPYWNWYTFPTLYTLGYGFTEFVAYVAAGLAIAAILRPSMASD